MTSLVLPTPVWSSTLSDTMLAPGATPAFDRQRSAVAGHHAGDVRAVTVTVVHAFAGEVQARGDARLEIGMERNAGVDHGDANAASRESPREAIDGPHLVRAHRRRDRIRGAANVEVERQALDAGRRGELLDLVRLDFDGGNLCGHLPANPAPKMGGLTADVVPRTRRHDDGEAPGPGCLLAQRRRDRCLCRHRGRHQEQSNETERSSVCTRRGFELMHISTVSIVWLRLRKPAGELRRPST